MSRTVKLSSQGQLGDAFDNTDPASQIRIKTAIMHLAERIIRERLFTIVKHDVESERPWAQLQLEIVIPENPDF